MAIGTTRGKRRLGRYLRPFVQAAGLTPDQLALAVRTSPQTVKRLLKGDNLPGFHLFSAVLGALELSGEDKRRALELYEVADADISTIEHAGSLQPKYRRFRLDESEAAVERVIDTVVITGLLQTEAYAKALAVANRPAWKGQWDAETSAAERKNRQSLLLRPDNPLRLHALLDERVLDLVVGGPDVMVEQFGHLVEMAHRSNVDIQILPKKDGPYGAMSGPLFLLGFPEEDEPDSAYVESLLGGHVVEKDEDVAMLSAVWDGAHRMALSADESITVIEAARARVERDR
jgi:hypothetical protein